MQRVQANVAISVSDLKRNPTAIMGQANGQPVAVLIHNRVMAYMVPADTYEAMLDRLDDIDLAEIIKSRSNETGIPVDLNAL